MEKYAWKAIVKDGCLDEYIRRHDNLPQEMQNLLHQAGITNYSIWNVGNELFGYYECEKGIDFAVLGGRRQRYSYFGFELAGVSRKYWLDKTNLRHCFGSEENTSECEKRETDNYRTVANFIHQCKICFFS